jgi:hypothetical protein
MREQAKASAMPIFPLFVIGTTMLAMLLYLVVLQASSPSQPGERVYVRSAYGVSEPDLAPLDNINARNTTSIRQGRL